MPEPAPFVSVVVIAGDDPKLLTLTLESLRRQSVSPEVVVVDGGGGGETDSIALQTGVPARFYRVSFPTAAEAWNHGVRQTGGEYVCLLEAGQQLPPAYLEECLFLLETSASEICLPWSGSPEWEDILSRDLSGGAGVLSRRAWNCTAGCDPSLPAGMARWELAVRMMYSGAQGCLYGEPPAGAGSCPPDAAAILHERYRWLDAGQLPFQKTASQTPRAGRLFVPAAAPGGKTVLLAMPFLTMGGSEAIVSQLCRRLKGLGFRILVVTTMPVMESQGDTTPWFEDATAAIYHLPRFLEPGLWSPFILHLLAQHSVDLLWQIGSSYVYDLLPSIKQSFPQLAVVDLLFNPVGHTANYLKYNYLIDHVVTEHEGMKQWLIERGEAKETISVIPNGVDLDRYRPEPKRDWRKPEPGGAGAFVVGYMGRLSEEKAPDTFVGIAAGLAGCDGIEFLVCGVGPMEDRLRAAVESAGLSGRVHFLGFVNSGEYLPCFDVTVVCSRLDGRPNLVMESLAMGVPVVASRVGGIPELLGDGEGGILCDAEDVPAFCDAILEWKNHPERRAEAARRARRRAEERFSLTGAGQEYASLFHRLTALAASRGGGPRPHLAAPAKRAAATRAAGSALVALRVAAMLLSPARLGLTFRNAVLWWKLRGDPAGAADIERFFDRTYYMMTYPDVAASGCPAILHYFFCGYLEDRRPSRRFSPSAYLTRYPDVAASRVNPLLHFAAFGRREGRSPSA